jgi:hypothetical protein
MCLIRMITTVVEKIRRTLRAAEALNLELSMGLQTSLGRFPKGVPAERVGEARMTRADMTHLRLSAAQ